jgi:PucR family transcriptional regulator, purine catabolism regulatory protein
LYKPYNSAVPLKVGDLLRISGLELRPLAGKSGMANAIRWVHVSELGDPTPWLKGGELLLTVGMGVGTTAAKQRAYVGRLTAAGLSGLGFGTGFSFRSVPKALIEAAERASFPIFEVPYEVPFIAITEAVFTRLVAEQYDLLSRSLDAEHTLTREVMEGHGVEGIVRALTRATSAWAVLLDLHGEAMAAHPPAAHTYLPILSSEVRSARADGLRFSLSLVEHGQHIAIQPVAAQGRVEAFLAVGKREALTQFDRIVSSHALSLLALELTKARAVSETERRLKGDVLDQILRGVLTPVEAREALERLGFDLAKPFAAAALCGSDPPEVLARTCEEALSRGTGAFLASPRDEAVLVVWQPEGPGFLAPLRAAVAARASDPLLAGAGGLAPFDHLLQAVKEARYALQVCRTEGRPEAEFADLGTYQLLLSLQDPEALSIFADSVLATLDRYDRAHGGELLPSLRAFLERNARWESAANDLAVHRHTLRYRMRKVEELTGRALSSARDRMEFFLALRARDMLASGDWRSGANGSARASGPRLARQAGPNGRAGPRQPVSPKE